MKLRIPGIRNLPVAERIAAFLRAKAEKINNTTSPSRIRVMYMGHELWVLGEGCYTSFEGHAKVFQNRSMARFYKQQNSTGGTVVSE